MGRTVLEEGGHLCHAILLLVRIVVHAPVWSA